MRIIALFSIAVLTTCRPEAPPADHHDHNSGTTTQTAAVDLMLTDSQMRLANVTVGQASKEWIGESVTLTGRIVADERNTETINARVSGRVEGLRVRQTGVSVKRGEPLYSIYSEELLSLQQEYLLAREQSAQDNRYASFINAARQKLLLYGQSPRQLEDLDKSGRGSGLTPFVSPASGIVKEIMIVEGQYVTEGQTMLRIEDITQLWVVAEVYGDEAYRVKPGDHAIVMTEGNDPVESKVKFINPEYANGAQTLEVRIDLRNNGGLFPGSRAQVVLPGQLHQAITVPADAVIRTSRGDHVYVLTAANTFRPRRVKTGMESNGRIEIMEGLREGDSVATTGAYLLYGEYMLKKGIDPVTFAAH